MRLMRLPGVDGVQRGINDVAGLARGQRDLHGLPVANFADEDHLWRLAQRRPQPGGEIRKIPPQLPLGEGRLARAGA